MNIGMYLNYKSIGIQGLEKFSKVDKAVLSANNSVSNEED